MDAGLVALPPEFLFLLFDDLTCKKLSVTETSHLFNPTETTLAQTLPHPLVLLILLLRGHNRRLCHAKILRHGPAEVLGQNYCTAPKECMGLSLDGHGGDGDNEDADVDDDDGDGWR